MHAFVVLIQCKKLSSLTVLQTTEYRVFYAIHNKYNIFMKINIKIIFHFYCNMLTCYSKFIDF